MSLNARITAAAKAVAAHTSARWIDDDGNPVGIGTWHLLYSLYDYCDSDPRLFPLDTILETPQDWSFDAPFLIRVSPAPRNLTVAHSSEPTEYVVKAASVEAASAEVLDMPVRTRRAEQRISRDPYLDSYLPPEWEAYAGGAIIAEGRPETIGTGVDLAVKSGWMPSPAPADYETEVHMEPAEAGALAVRVYREAIGHPEGDPVRDVENLLRGLREYMMRFGEDMDAMVKDVRSERADIQITSDEEDMEMSVPKL